MDLVSIVTTLITFVLVGFLVYLIITYVPMPEPFKQVIIVACIILIVLYLLFLLGGRVAPISLRR